MTNFKIIEEATNKQYQDLLKHEIKHATWTLVDDITLIKNVYERSNFGFVHSVFKNDAVISPLFPLLYPLLLEMANNLGLKVTQILHIKTILLTSDTEAPLHNNPHVDRLHDHAVFLYYVNDSDGDTFLFKETLADHPNPDIAPISEFSIDQRITPKQGRALYFEGRTYHASSRPSKGCRMIINFDVLVEPINQTGTKND